MNILLTFDSNDFTRQLVAEDDKRMVDYIILEYGPALQHAIRCYEGDVNGDMLAYYQDKYLTAILANDNKFHDDPVWNVTPNVINSFYHRVVDEEGNVQSNKARYLELVEACIQHFNSQIVAVLRNIQNQGVLIYTVVVVGYANRRLNLMLNTERAIQP